MPKELEHIRSLIVKSLRKHHPEWGEKKIQEASWGTAQNVYKKKYKGGK